MIKKIVKGILILAGVIVLVGGCASFTEGFKEGLSDSRSNTTVENKVESTNEITPEVADKSKESENITKENQATNTKVETENDKKNKTSNKTKENKETEEFDQKKYWENYHRENVKVIPEPNTTEMVNYQISKANVDIIDKTDEELNELVKEAYEFIQSKAIQESYFESNETMESLMYYGELLEEYYETPSKYNELAKIIMGIGTDTVQIIKYTYRGHEDGHGIKSNHEQIIKGFMKANEIVKQSNQ